MKLKQHGAFWMDFVDSFSNGEISRFEFDLDYSGYVIEHFPHFEAEAPPLAAKLGRIIDGTYESRSWMTDDAFRLAMSDALDEFLGTGHFIDLE